MSGRFPEWLKKRVPSADKLKEVKGLLTDLNLNTVCQSADCPNLGECFAKKTATFMILGNICTRNCRFCAVTQKKPQPVDPQEPENVARAVANLELKYVVITSVTRDDLSDGGVSHFVQTVRRIKELSPETKIELLTPDFKGDKKLILKLLQADFAVFNHNVETVPELYSKVRPEADYQCSLNVLNYVKKMKPEIYTKSGIMVGLGETKEQIIQVLKDLRGVDCDILTIGQYLSPTKNHLDVKEFITPSQFAEYEKIGKELGFKALASGPFVRSSYQAEKLI